MYSLPPSPLNEAKPWVSSTILRLLMLVLALAGQIIAWPAAGPSAPVHEIDGSFIKDWLVLGPFPSKAMEIDFLEAAGGEANVRPKEGDTVTTRDGKVFTWKRLQSKYDLVNLEQALGGHEWAVAYAYCELNSAASAETDFRTFVNEKSMIWVNGQALGQVIPRLWSERDIPTTVPIRLKSGRNDCLLKLKQEEYEWQFMVQPLPPTRAVINLHVTDADQHPAPDALIELYDKGKLAGQLRTDAHGTARVCLYPSAESYDIRATFGEAGAWLYHFLPLRGGEKDLEMRLGAAVSISGRVLASDGSPQNALIVQALPISDHSDFRKAPFTEENDSLKSGTLSVPKLPPFSAAVLSDANGHFRFVNLRPGKYQLRCHSPDGFIAPVTNGTKAQPPVEVIEVKAGQSSREVKFVFPQAKKGIWKTIPITRGLREIGAYTVHRTPDGTLWIGTDEGVLFAYDGAQFTTFSGPEIPGSQIAALVDGSGNSLWIGMNKGVSRYSAGRVQLFSNMEGLPRTGAGCILEDPDGTVWIGTGSGLIKQKGTNTLRLTIKDGLPSNFINSMIRARDGALWVGTWNGLARLSDQGIREFHPFNGLSNRRIGIKLHQARDGSIWFLALRGVYQYADGKVERLGSEHGLPSDDVSDIGETSDGALWFATTEGLSRFDGKTMMNFNEHDGLSSRGVSRIFIDSDDVIWCATGAGVSRFEPKRFIGFTKQDGLTNRDGGTPTVFAIEPDSNGRFWLGAEWSGLFRTDGKHIEALESGAKRYCRRIHRAKDGTLWLAGDGIYKRDNDKTTRVLDRSWVLALSSDNDGNLWYGNGWVGGGLSSFNPQTGQSKTFGMADGLPSNDVWSIALGRDGELWVGTEAGLARYKAGVIEPWNPKLGIATGTIFDLQPAQDGSLWISSRQGVYRLQDGKLTSITITNGLPDQHVWSTAQTRDGIIWMGNDNYGLLGYDGRAVTAIDKRDGLLGNRAFSLAVAGGDSLLIGFLDGGLTRYQPSKSRPSVRLTEVRQGDQSFAEFSNLPKTQTGQRIGIRFQAIDLKTHPDKRQFWYRLSGPSGQTLYAGTTRDPRFDWTPRISGTHLFEVQAIDRDLNYSAPAQLAFHVIVPWYANAWILIPSGGGILMLVLFSAFSGWRNWTNRLEANRLREQMLTHEREARSVLEQTNKSLDIANRAKSMFVANMSHEIRTPLNAVLGFAGILQQDKSLSTRHRQSIGTIERTARHLLDVINQILDLSKIEAGHMELSENECDLTEVIQDLSAIFEPQCRGKGIEWRVEVRLRGTASASETQKPGQEPSAKQFESRGDESPVTPAATSFPLPALLVRADNGKLRQVLINILGNAVKFTDAGYVSLRVIEMDPAAKGVSSVEKPTAPAPGSSASIFLFEIEDTGPGIPYAVCEKIFEPFTQGEEGRRKGGTGLGLALARRHIDLMGGQLQVHSEPGEGSKFTVTLPLARCIERPESPSRKRQKQHRKVPPDRGIKALIADDVHENREVLQKFLEHLGISVTACDDGEQALAALRENEFPIAFLDIRMPGLSGLEVASRILTDSHYTKRTKLIATSASVLVHEQDLYRKKGFDGFLAKPIDNDRLCDCLETQLGLNFERESSDPLEGAGISSNKQSPDGPVNWERLDELFSDDLNEREQFLERYIRSAPGQIEELRQLLNSGNMTNGAILAHRCLGTSAHFGFQTLAPLMQQIEQAAEAGDLARCNELLAKAMEALDAARAIVEQHLGRKIKPPAGS